MALHTQQRLFYGSRYYGDGSYQTTAPSFVLTDRATGSLYRVTVPGGSITLVPITVLSATDKREDFMSVQDLTTPSLFLNAYVSSGTLRVESTQSLSRDAYVHDGGTRYKIKHSNGSLIAVVS